MFHEESGVRSDFQLFGCSARGYGNKVVEATSPLSIQFDQDHRALSQVRCSGSGGGGTPSWYYYTNRSSLRHALRLPSSFVRPHGRWSVGLWAFRPSVRPARQVPWSVRVRMSGPAPPLLQIITRDFLTISVVRGGHGGRRWRVRRGGKRQQRVTTAIIS